MAEPLGKKGSSLNDQPSLWDVILPSALLVLPDELARVDRLLDAPAFVAPFASFFDARICRPSVPMETYLRMMFLKFRYRLGFESLCREVSDSITWRQFCRIGIDQPVPHPTTLMKLTTRCGSAAVDGCNEALLAKAADTDQLAVPAQDGGRGDEQPEAAAGREQSGEGGDQGTIGPAHPWARRWSTASWWRRTRISISLAVSEWVRSTIQLRSLANIW